MSSLTPEERQRIYEEEKARKEAQDRLAAENKSKQGKSPLVGCLSIIVLLVLLGILIGNCGDNEPRSEHDPITAFVMSQSFVEDRLKSPSTAKFPTYSESQVRDLGTVSISFPAMWMHKTPSAPWLEPSMFAA
jgi:hypothetical protein